MKKQFIFSYIYELYSPHYTETTKNQSEEPVQNKIPKETE